MIGVQSLDFCFIRTLIMHLAVIGIHDLTLYTAISGPFRSSSLFLPA